MYPENVIYLVDIKVHVKGIYNVRSIESSLSGLAEGMLLESKERTSKRVTHLLKNWNTVTSETDRSEGYLHATCTAFGLPADHTKAAEENTLNLSVRLVDNETVLDYAFLVGNRIQEERLSCTPVLYIELGKPAIELPDPDDPDQPDEPDNPDEPDVPDEPDTPGYDDPDEPIVFPDVKPEGSFDGGVSIDPGFSGDHSMEIKNTKEEKKEEN